MGRGGWAKEPSPCRGQSGQCTGFPGSANLVGERPGPSVGAASSFIGVPLLDELRTCCYEHQIEEIPALLAV